MVLTKETPIIKPIFENIPDEMKQLNRWVCWKAVPKQDKSGEIYYTKIPFQPNRVEADHSILGENTWSSFKDVKHAYENDNYFDGIGFVISEGYVGIDIDKCLDEKGELSNTAKYILSSVDSFYEKSVSGTGLHVYVKGEIPVEVMQGQNWRKTSKLGDHQTKELELARQKFFTVTGVTDYIKPLKLNQDGLNRISYRYFRKAELQNQNNLPQKKEKSQNKSNSQIWQMMFNSKNGQAIKALYDGFLINNDHSSSDMALCNQLAFWTDKDPFKMDTMFRESALMRPKWDEMRGIGTYGQITIEKAMRDTVSTLSDYNKPSASADFGSGTNELLKKLEYNKNGDKVLCNSRNMELILNSSPFKGILAFDAFKNMEAIRGNLPWRKRERPHKPYEPWLGADDKRLQHYLGKEFDFKTVNVMMNAYTEVSRHNSFHPVKEYLEAQKWDGIPRVDTFFIDYLGADDTAYVRAATRKWLVAAIARIYEPGCKFDYMPVLVGPQGAGKSSIIERLAREWFSDSLKNFDSKEAGEHLQNSWIFEFGELAAMKKSAVEEIKAFITKTTDSYRVAYDRVVSEFPRKCVFIGTTNTHDFLRDQTGNRRFWPITVDPKKRKLNHFESLTEMVIGQIWAEAKRLYVIGEPLFLDPILEEEARKIQDNHLEQDPRTGIIQDYLETLLPEEWDNFEIWQRRAYLEKSTGTIQRTKVCAAEIWAECLGKENYKDIQPWESRQICDILRKLGWKERNPKQTRFKHYGRQTTFIKE